jgi:hypothetical protein
VPFEQNGLLPLDASMTLRLTSVEKQRIADEADFAGISMSELVRRRYFGRPIIASSDEVMIKELRRIGGLLKHIHNESQGAYSARTASMLGELSAYITQLSKGEHR